MDFPPKGQVRKRERHIYTLEFSKGFPQVIVWDGGGNGGLDLNVLSRGTICFWFWQEALQMSRPDFISRSQCRVRELERRKWERRALADSVDQQSDAALRQRRQRRVHSARPTPLNGTVPAAILTSLISCAANCPIAAAVAVCHVQSHIQTQNKARGIVL